MASEARVFVQVDTPRVYPYRTTTDKLTRAFAEIEAAGDAVIHPVYVGGRDWVLICREGGGDRG